jgi:hypothetical protein
MTAPRDPVAANPVTPGNAEWSWEGCFTNGQSLYKCLRCRQTVRAHTPEIAEYEHNCKENPNEHNRTEARA